MAGCVIEAKRTLDQNAKLHAMFRDLANQVIYCERKFTEEQWKFMVMGGLYGQDMIPNPVGGGMVVFNKRRTSKLLKPELSDVIMEVMAFGDERGVKWTDEQL